MVYGSIPIQVNRSLIFYDWKYQPGSIAKMTIKWTDFFERLPLFLSQYHGSPFNLTANTNQSVPAVCACLQLLVDNRIGVRFIQKSSNPLTTNTEAT